MKRLTERYIDGIAKLPHGPGAIKQIADMSERLAQIEDILGTTYDLDRLRELVEENKKSRARKCPKCGRMRLYPRIDWKYFYCYSCETTFPAEEIMRPKAALAKEADHE